ncbi:hypothetical protein KAU43_07480 [candidate division WOR-3 bacterium]|nr:hypothetical protein [candidate division WOR-3 bacterium]
MNKTITKAILRISTVIMFISLSIYASYSFNYSELFSESKIDAGILTFYTLILIGGIILFIFTKGGKNNNIERYCDCSAYFGKVRLYECVIRDGGGLPCPYVYTPERLWYKPHKIQEWFYAQIWKVKNWNLYKTGKEK